MTITGNWERIKAKIIRRFRDIKEEQLHFEQGKEKELLDQLEELTGLKRAELAFMIRKMQVNINNNRL